MRPGLLIFAVLVAAVLWFFSQSRPQVLTPEPDPAEPRISGEIEGHATAIDGDSLRIDTRVIRLHGIDAFEYDQTCATFVCGQASKRHLQGLIAGHTVICRSQDEDSYGRTVAVCTIGQTDLAAEQVKAGLAIAYSRYSRKYVSAEAEARSRGRGAWAYEFQSPETYRHAPDYPRPR